NHRRSRVSSVYTSSQPSAVPLCAIQYSSQLHAKNNRADRNKHREKPAKSHTKSDHPYGWSPRGYWVEKLPGFWYAGQASSPNEGMSSSEAKPSRNAKSAACVRLARCSLPRMLLTWVLT